MILAGFQQLVFSHSLGFPYNQPVRAVCWHTTEGSSVQGAVSVYKNIQACPHMTVDPETFERFQHVPLDSAAYALRNDKGGCETNATGIIQIEVVGKASEAWSWSQQRLRWLGEEVLAPILDAYPTIPRVVYPGGRMNCDQWETWSGGICRHADVPENDHCVSVETPILTADLQWVPAGQLAVGDELIGFDEATEPVGSTAGRRFRPSFVTRNEPFKSPAMRVVTEYGDVLATPDHPWLVEVLGIKRGPRRAWVGTQNLDPTIHRLYHSAAPWKRDRSHTAGWLAGVLDADGHASTNRDAGANVSFGQMAGRMLDRFIFEMESRGFTLKVYERPAGRGYNTNAGFHEVRVTGGLWEQLRVLGTLDPVRLNLRAAWDGAAVGKTCNRIGLHAVERAGDAWMAGLTTSTKTYVANGFLVHNTDPGDLDLQRILDYATGDDMTLAELAAAMGPHARFNNGLIEIRLRDDNWYPWGDAIRYTHQEAQDAKGGGGGSVGPLSVTLTGTATPT